MQMRFDGTLGFPGGVIDQGETPEQAVMRELAEEMGGSISVERSDHVFTSYSISTKFCLHFYAKCIALDLFVAIESGITQARDWGGEVSRGLKRGRSNGIIF